MLSKKIRYGGNIMNIRTLKMNRWWYLLGCFFVSLLITPTVSPGWKVEYLFLYKEFCFLLLSILSVPRLRDIGWNSWVAILMLVPIANLAPGMALIFFFKGSKKNA